MDEAPTSALTDLLLRSDDPMWEKQEPWSRYAALCRQTPGDFPSYYLALLEEKGMARSEAIANSGLEVHYAYQILSGVKKPRRDKLLCLCIGAGFSLLQTDRALERAEFSPLYPKRLRDAVIMLAVNRGCRTVWQVNELLAERGEALLG